MARKKTSNKKPLSPSLAKFGFTTKKRQSDGGNSSPPKRLKSSGSIKSSGSVKSNSSRTVVDLSQVVDLSKDDSSPEQQTTKQTNQKSRNESSSTAPTTPPKSHPKPTPLSPSRTQSNAIGLLRVENPNNILCTTAAAQARSSTTTRPIHKVFPGATLGRTSNSSSKDGKFVNLGIGSNAKGISRRHVTVLKVDGVSDGDDNTSIVTAKSRSSLNTSTSHRSTHSHRSTSSTSNPTMLIKVIPHPDPTKETVRIIIHRTRRNKRRELILKQGECKTLRVGDCLEFISERRWFFCVVAFNDGSVQSAGLERGREEVGGERGVGLGKRGREEIQIGNDVDMTQEVVDVDDLEDVKMVDVPQATDSIKVERTTDGVSESKNVQVSRINNEFDNSSLREQKLATNQAERLSESDPTPMSVDSSGDTKHNAQPKTEKSQLPPVSAPKPIVKPNQSTNTIDKRVSVTATAALPKNKAEQKAAANPPTFVKGDNVRVTYELVDAFGLKHDEWHYGKIGLTRTNTINVSFDSGESDKFDIPSPEVEAVDDMAKVYSQPLKIGDFVESFFAEHKWYHGRVADISEDGRLCEVFYHDKDYEVNIPTNQNKIRVSRPCGSNYEWLINRPVLIGQKGSIELEGASYKGECQVIFKDGSHASIECDDIISGNDAYLLSNCKAPKRKNVTYDWLNGGPVLVGRKGVVKNAPRDGSTNNCVVMFEDGTEESISCDTVMKGAFAFLLQDVAIHRQYVWRGKEMIGKDDNSSAVEQSEVPMAPAPRCQATKKAERGRKKSSAKRVSIKLEDEENDYQPINGHRLVFKIGLQSQGKMNGSHESATDDSPDDPDAEFRFIGKKKVALPLPPGTPNMMWHALNCAEAKTGANMFQDFLCVHDRVPGPDTIRKFWQLMIKGPKADGQDVFFKDPFRTELASHYVYSLVQHGKRLIRSDGSPLFGPSEWDDVESLLKQPIEQTENMTAGKRLADGLHLAARGSKLLLMMLQTEMRDVDMLSPPSNSWEKMPLKAMPTVKQFKMNGVRNSLKSVVKRTTECLVHHSRFILDIDDFHPNRLSYKENFFDESCTHEARECFDNMGNVISFSAYLVCMSERKQLDDPDILLLIKSEFETELKRSLDHMPDPNEASKNKFMGILRENFIGAIGGDFSLPLFIGLSKLMGYGKDLANLGLYVD